MRPMSFVFALALLPALALPTAAQGPPAGPPGNLKAAVEDLTGRVEELEARAALLESENSTQEARIVAIEIELDRTDRTVPAGTVVPFAGDASQVPAGWLLCDGAELDPVGFPRLFAVIGTSHGAGEAGTFRLPDYRGMFLRGVDLGRGIDPDRASRGNFAGGPSGDRVGTVQGGAFAWHGHSLGAFGLCDVGTPNGGLAPFGNIFQPCHARTVSSAVGGNETRPVNVYVHFIIKD